MERLFLIDGSAIAYRSFFALNRQHLTTSRGEPTGAVYGYTRFIVKLLKDHQPEFVAVCFDTARPTFRHMKYPAYKATRKKAPDDLKAQIPRIGEVTDALGLYKMELEGYEADDVIGTLARRAEAQGMKVYLISPDKDLLQLVSERVSVFTTTKTSQKTCVYDAEKVRERYGVDPSKLVDVLGLAGDATDNVPGVRGIGEKTAIQLISQFGSVEDVLSNIDKISGRALKDNLSRCAEMALLSKELVTIKTDLDLALEIGQLKYRGADTSRLIRVFRELEFFSFLSEIAGEDAKIEYSKIEGKKLLPKLLS